MADAPKKSKILSALSAWEATSGMRASAGFFKGGKYPDGTSIPQTMFYNEGGTRSKDGKQHSPPRPVMRTTRMKHHSKWIRLLHRLISQGMDPNTAYSQVAEVMAGDIKDEMAKFTTPGNAEATIKQKGFDAPLRKTKWAMKAVRYEVNRRKTKGGL